MKILIATIKNDYDDYGKITARVYSAAYFLWYAPLAAYAEAHGHTLVPFWMDEATQKYGDHKANEMLLEAMLAKKPELAIFHGCMIDQAILQKIKEQSKAITVYCGGDDSWSFDTASKYMAPYCSLVVTWYSKAVKKYLKIGCKNVLGSQTWADTAIYHPTGEKKDIEVSFVGTANPARIKIIQGLRKAGIPVFVRGNGWPEGGMPQDDMVSVISRSKIGLSLDPPAFYVGWKPIIRLFFRRARVGEPGPSVKFDGQHFFSNVRTWFQKTIRQIKGRHFEIPACGTMEITQLSDDLEKYYEPGKEIILYRTIPDLVQKIHYYLEHDEEREAIARASYERTLRDHTFEQRMNEILERVGLA